MPRRSLRLFVVPAVLLAVVSGAMFALAKWHPAKPERASTRVPVVETSGATRGEALFSGKCARCHGEGGRGGGIGPTLAGSEISREDARSTITNGSGAMPAGLVAGQELEDVLAFLESILGST